MEDVKKEKKVIQNTIMELAEILWMPQSLKKEVIEFDDSIMGEMARFEYEKRIRQCETFLSFIKGMKGKDLEPYLSKVNINISSACNIEITIKIPLQTRLRKLS